MSERTLALRIAYDGTDFRGFQIQPKTRTVQSVLESGLERLFEEPLRLVCAGRTDSGVHADGQVISIRTANRAIPAEKVAVALNTRLPADVCATASVEVPEEFHARYSALLRTYRYWVYASPLRNPEIDRRAVRLRRTPSLVLLNRYAAQLEGTHDFTTFASSRDRTGSRVRAVERAVWFAKGRFLVFEISARSFMWHMVRSIVGTLVALEASDEPPSRLREMLQAGDRSLAATTAAARGLVFHSVEYPRDIPGVEQLSVGPPPVLSSACRDGRQRVRRNLVTGTTREDHCE